MVEMRGPLQQLCKETEQPSKHDEATLPCDRDLERRLHDINQKVVEAERKLREAESSTPDLSSSEKVRPPVIVWPTMVLNVSPHYRLANNTVGLHRNSSASLELRELLAAGIGRAGHA